MSQLNRLQFVVLDDEGNPISGVSVKVHRQGATVQGSQAGPAYTVDDPGAVAGGDDVYSNNDQSYTRTVSAVTASVVTTGALTLGTLADDDRIMISSTLPTLYNDAQGNETKSNPLTTDVSGIAECWIVGNKFDVIYTKSGYATRVEYDRVAEGTEDNVSNVFDGATAVGFRVSSGRTLATAGARVLTVENPRGTGKMFIDKDGDVDTTGTLDVDGASTVAALTASGLITGSAGGAFAAPFTYSR